MNWYLSKIVYRILCGDGEHTAQFDEQLRLVKANNKGEAFHKAKRVGKAEEEIFLNDKQELVQWKFINVSELYKLGALIDGAEVYSRIEERKDADDYIHSIHVKADHILSGHSLEILKLV
jgi:hypothetical protein